MEVFNKLCRTALRNGGSCFRSYINRFISADTIVPDPTNPQQYNRYSYALNNALKYLDPSGHIACNDPHLPEEGRCLNDGSWGPGTVVYYLNGLGGSETIEPQNVPETLSEYNYILFVLEELYGEESVFHVPVFTNGFQRGRSQLELFAEALGSAKPQTHKALEFILENPPYPGERVVIVGSSAGGTVAVELLPLLKQHEIFVDQLILRGSPVFELSLGNVGRVDYLAGDPPLSDPYYSIDINPFDGVSVHEHVIPGLTNHAPNRTVDPVQTLRNIGSLLVNLLEQ